MRLSHVVSRLLATVWRSAPLDLVALVAVTVLSGLTPAASAWINRAILNAVATGTDGTFSRSAVLHWALALGAVGLLAGVLPHARQYLNNDLKRRVGLLVQDTAYRVLNAVPGLRRYETPSFMDKLRVGLDAGGSAPNSAVIAGLRCAQSMITGGTFLVALMLIAPVLALLVLMAAIPAVIAELALSRKGAQLQWQLSPANRRQIFYRGIQTDRQAAKELRVFGLGDFLRSRMLSELRSINDEQRRLDRRVLRTEGTLAIIAALVAAAGTTWTVLEAAGGHRAVGDIALFVMAVIGVQGALASTVTSLADAQSALLLFRHFVDVVEMEPDLVLPASPTPVPALSEGIEMRDVWFKYDDGHPWILAGLNLFIPYGASVALVGRNGAGKSTVVKLLSRMYDPDEGAIFWDGVDIREMDPAELRARIGAVFQDYMAYDLTAAENVGIGDLGRLGDQEAIQEAAMRAGAHETITQLHSGYETLLSRIFAPLGDSHAPAAGVMPSGGEWQRLALARAFMRHDRDLLILDEPNSGLDAEAEHAIHCQLSEIRRGRTSLLIAQRLSAVRNADRIYVLGKGRVVEQGCHAELMGRDGVYRRLFTLQAKGYQDDSIPVRDGSRSVAATTTTSEPAVSVLLR
jgi:ATP-binding cassette, subfamily B, bacterial